LQGRCTLVQILFWLSSSPRLPLESQLPVMHLNQVGVGRRQKVPCVW